MEINQLFKANKIKNNKEFFYEFFLLIGFIIIGTIGRTLLVGGNLQPFPNFEIIMVLTFIAAILIRPTLAILVPIFSMILSDLLIGNPIFIGSQMNKIVLFTYSGFALIALINIFNRDRFRNIFTSINLKNISFSGFCIKSDTLFLISAILSALIIAFLLIRKSTLNSSCPGIGLVIIYLVIRLRSFQNHYLVKNNLLYLLII